MSDARIVVRHKRLSKSITINVERGFLARATTGNNTFAQRALAIKVKNAYNAKYDESVTYLPWSGISIEETVPSQEKLQGCALDDCCAGCDQGHHCHNRDRGCYM